jgi:hypothetical protein
VRRCQTDEAKPFPINTRANTRALRLETITTRRPHPFGKKIWRPKENREHNEKAVSMMRRPRKNEKPYAQ